ncbi:hypothetical protein ACFL1H_00325 [Nanoarchaeota archaeon]
MYNLELKIKDEEKSIAIFQVNSKGYIPSANFLSDFKELYQRNNCNKCDNILIDLKDNAVESNASEWIGLISALNKSVISNVFIINPNDAIKDVFKIVNYNKFIKPVDYDVSKVA